MNLRGFMVLGLCGTILMGFYTSTVIAPGEGEYLCLFNIPSAAKMPPWIMS
jgi:hypothetical protein